MDEYIMRDGELYHYGVLGMKWGVHRNPSLAYNRAVKKKRKLEDRRIKIQAKADKKIYKSSKKLARSVTDIGYTQAQEGLVKGHKLANKASKLAKKEHKWDKAMDKAFADMSITKIPENELATGRNFINNLVFGKEQYRVEKN